MRYISPLILIIVFTVGCNNKDLYTDDLPIVRVGDNYLYPEQIAKTIPENLKANDSAAIAKKYIDNWIMKKLKIGKAELNLPDEEKDLTDELEDFRASLLIYKYEQQLINQKLDTAISKDEIEEYYNKRASEFRLETDIVKADYVKIAKDVPDSYKVRNLMRSDKNSDRKLLLDYCETYAEEFSFDNNWMYFNVLQKACPINTYGSMENYLKYNSFIENRDSLFRYFININDFKLKNDTTPLSLVKDKISVIVLNKKKLQLINEMENDMYQTAIKKGNLQIY